MSSTTTTRPKLTGWAQAAARAAPAKEQTLPVKTEPVSDSKNSSAKNIRPVATTPIQPKKSNSNNNQHNNHGHNSSSRKFSNPRHPFNRNEVRDYMNDLFQKYSTDKNTVSYRELLQNKTGFKPRDASWGAVSGSKKANKNKKYSVLNDIAKTLKS